MGRGAEWVEFDAPVEPMPWGRNVYTVVKVAQALADAAAGAGTRRVEGVIDDVTVNLGLNRADVIPETFVYAGASLRRRLGVRAGDLVHCRLRPADPDEVPLADDVRRALHDAGVLAAFEQRTPAERRRLLAPVDGAATATTRQRRLDALVRSLDS